MTYDEKGIVHFESEEEERLFKEHGAQFGPSAGINMVHQDNCDYCEEKGWDTHPEKTTPAAKESQHRDHMAEYGPNTGKSHPDECGKCE